MTDFDKYVERHFWQAHGRSPFEKPWPTRLTLQSALQRGSALAPLRLASMPRPNAAVTEVPRGPGRMPSSEVLLVSPPFSKVPPDADL